MDPACYSPAGLAQFILLTSGLKPECAFVLGATQSSPQTTVAHYTLMFLLTCLLEAPFYLMALNATRPGVARKTAAIVLPNLATHPIVCFVIPYLVFSIQGTFALNLLLAEIFAPVVEAALLFKFWNVPLKRAVSWSFAANLFSWWAGIYIVNFLG